MLDPSFDGGTWCWRERYFNCTDIFNWTFEEYYIIVSAWVGHAARLNTKERIPISSILESSTSHDLANFRTFFFLKIERSTVFKEYGIWLKEAYQNSKKSSVPKRRSQKTFFSFLQKCQMVYAVPRSPWSDFPFFSTVLVKCDDINDCFEKIFFHPYDPSRPVLFQNFVKTIFEKKKKCACIWSTACGDN